MGGQTFSEINEGMDGEGCEGLEKRWGEGLGTGGRETAVMMQNNNNSNNNINFLRKDFEEAILEKRIHAVIPVAV